MKKLLLIIFATTHAWAAFSKNDSLLRLLEQSISETEEYDSKKIAFINKLKENETKILTESFIKNEKIYEQYKVFKYDSSYHYAVRLIQIAEHNQNNEQLIEAKVKLAFVMLSAGYYKDTHDSLQSINANNIIDTATKVDYYILWGRYYYDLDDANYSSGHDSIGSRYIDSALVYTYRGSFEYEYYRGLQLLKEQKYLQAKVYLQTALAITTITDHQIAIVASTLSDIYRRENDVDMAISLLVKASIADIRSSTKETFAIFYLSDLLYKQGNLPYAGLFIESAISNAAFYGARQRMLQASAILPIIEAQRIRNIEKEKAHLIEYAVTVTILVIALIILAFVIRSQIKKLKFAQQALELANRLEQDINIKLKAANSDLEEINNRLIDANEKIAESDKIKEEYIRYFFNADSEFYSRMDRIKQTIEKKLAEKKYEDIAFFLRKIDARREKVELIGNFDKLFLKLFPHFVQELNKLLRPDEQIQLKNQELLNTDLRIFALIRMGISDTEKIASILDYSVKTIYTYKSKIKGKSDNPNDDFEQRIMQIKAF